MPPSFSVIVPTYNRPDLLRLALDSLRHQDLDDFECIVVDDGSDTAEAVVDGFDRRFRCIPLPANIGNYGARNVGIRASTGSAICFLDDDDAYTANRLELAQRGLRTVDVALCWARYMDDDSVSGRMLSGNVHSSILDRTVPPIGATAVRRSALPLFDDSYLASGDLEWWLRLSSKSAVATVSDVGYLVRRHHGVRSTNGLHARIAASQRILTEFETYFEEHPTALAFRKYRLGVMLRADGDNQSANLCFRQSILARPSLRAMRGLVSASLAGVRG